MREKYQSVEMEIIIFDENDVITTSDPACGWEGQEF